MFRLSRWSLGGALSRVSAAAASKQRGRKPLAQPARGRPHPQSARGSPPSKPGRKAVSRNSTPKETRAQHRSQGRASGRSSSVSSPSQSAKAATKREPPTKANTSALVSATDASGTYALVRPAYMSAEREQEVLQMAERMQKKDTTTEVPVASFAYEILKAHPSVRDMGLRERMDFLLKRWNRLSKAQRLDYVNDPLRGLL
ncbi:hypothetical protein LSCM1_06136 [Leishmania martiniquensis]|uniref:Uncharacterized protein n=1 Tax=Leishmania martiniquensis TaxID=1580590 RepID=A0A836KMP1_9TRYP|nr:hypothetical protein LSCM1_06136 [Leishmania martiniquensis]